MSAVNELHQQVQVLINQLNATTDPEKRKQIQEQIADTKEFIREIQYEHRM